MKGDRTMKRLLLNIFGVGTMLIAFVLLSPARGNAEVNVNINIPLPSLVISAPPAMIVIPGTYVYYPPDVEVDIFFYHGYWYRPHGGAWYIANGYNGPWRGIDQRRVPRALIDLPPGHRHIPPGHERVPYGQVKKNWRTWEKERHWDKHERGGHEGPGQGHGRGHSEGRHGND